MGGSFTVAAVQASYVLMNREATTSKVEELVRAAADQGARLIVFPEVFVPGTPIWIDSVPIWDGDEAWFAQLVDQAVVVPGPTTERIGAAAKDAGAYVVIGVDEREPHGTTIFNTLLYFGPDGSLVGRHRKLMPTGSERTVWGMGDGSTLNVVATELGRVGGLICWENYMPLARFSLYESGVEIYIASTADDSDAWQATLVHIARESRAFVVAPCHFQRASSYPEDFPLRDELEGSDIIGRGGSAILGPDGAYLAGPLYDREGILYAELDPTRLAEERQRFDPAGHYHRPDVFSLSVSPQLSQRAL